MHCSQRPFLAGAGQLRRVQPVAAVQARGMSVVAMAKPTTASEFRGMSDEDIKKEVYVCKRKLFDLRIALSLRKEFKAHEFIFYRRKSAQLLTILRERQIAQGIDRRQFKKLERQQRIADGFGRLTLGS